MADVGDRHFLRTDIARPGELGDREHDQGEEPEAEQRPGDAGTVPPQRWSGADVDVHPSTVADKRTARGRTVPHLSALHKPARSR